ncbi:ABC transporter permease [Staphylococcus lugdunensis]|uniref:ABC transporter permease n=1 Tax=Staphylococcus TaxID=1279 RepID=UPI0008A15739|nr:MULTISPECIES: ABC transporter permease [Staphylococcus]ARJ14308.1 spermidine/putrescine ABC transporter permease PotC [Staphylococcus lugdunensis]MCH8666156.1 ABC transporter permease [Staphylococcus lugdunensis]OFJ65172.1 spermidine/putrescine ABC transporter permease [Staphylococcus sp. HMSC077E11]OFM46077.1 spermidine/putrescine ABC transporter permease [Staphylococcus sp. HMSC077E12]OFR87897.1 spermidine/putrescine ABC transporter permease [Staphylococcus sp. HMSC059F04]
MKWYGKLYISILLVILYVPIFFLMFYSFYSGGNMIHFEHFTFEHYQSLFKNDKLMAIIFNTIAVALLAASISTVIGTFGAIALFYLRQKKLKVTLLTLNNVLMVSSDVVIGASFLIMFTALGHFTGIGLGFGTVLASHIAFCIPIVVIVVLPQLYEMNHNILNAARDLGATESQILSRVLIPNLMPAIIGGFFMALTYSLDDFTVSFFVTGNGFSVLSVEVYAMARKGISMEVNAISTLLFVVIVIGIVGYYGIQRSLKRKPRLKRGMLR